MIKIEKSNEEWLKELCPQFAAVMAKKPDRNGRYSENIVHLGLEPFEEMVRGEAAVE